MERIEIVKRAELAEAGAIVTPHTADVIQYGEGVSGTLFDALPSLEPEVPLLLMIILSASDFLRNACSLILLPEILPPPYYPLAAV